MVDHEKTARMNCLRYDTVFNDIKNCDEFLKLLPIMWANKYCSFRTGQGLALIMKLQLVGCNYQKVGHECSLADYNFVKNAVASSPTPPLMTHALSNPGET